MQLSQKTYQNDEIIVPVYGLGVRHIQILLVCFWNALCFTMCNVMPTCIVAMTNPGASLNPNIPTFPYWTNQSIILSSFGWGYSLPQIFGGYFAKRYGPKWFFIGVMAVGVACNISIPLVTIYYGPLGLIFCYLLEGLTQGFGIVMLPEFINTWVPQAEKTTLGNAIFAAYGPGCIFATNISGILCSSKWGWPSVFYLVGCLGLIWIILMLIFGENYPEQYKTMKKQELLFINHDKIREKEMNIPWGEVLSSKPMWALWIAHAGGQVLYWLTYIEFPTYISRVFGFSVGRVGQILSFFYLVSWLMSIVASSIVEYFINANILETGVLRKICNSIATFGPAIFLISLCYLSRHEKELALYFIMLLFITMSTAPSAYMINYNDITPNFCGVLFGIGGFLSCVLSLTAVGLTEIEVVNQRNNKQWAVVLWFCSIVAVSSNIIFVLYGSGKVQPWNIQVKKEDDEYTEILGDRQ